MGWHVYRLRYQLLSPLHIGFRRIGNLQCTRYYISGKTMWGAITAKLTRVIYNNPKPTDYLEVGQYIKDHIIMSYFFFRFYESGPFYPELKNGIMDMSGIPLNKFEASFLSSRSTTAIDHSNFAAEEGTLHEIELIMPIAMSDNAGKNVLIEGYIYIDQEKAQFPANFNFNDEDIIDNIRQLKIGADHGYGNGKINLIYKDLVSKVLDFPSPIDFNTTIRAHLKYIDKLLDKIEGPIEPIVGREWGSGSLSGPGQKISQAEICWMPGSKLKTKEIYNKKIKLKPFGIWEVENGENT
ncbi:MAG: hypothetical protein ACTSUK_11310 [Promethearchaeota archaeon]